MIDHLRRDVDKQHHKANDKYRVAYRLHKGNAGKIYGNTAQLTPHCHKKSDMLWNSCKLPIRLARAH